MMTIDEIVSADSLNGERVAPRDIPSTARVFLDWSTAACCEWPKELQAAAFYAQEALEGRAEAERIEQFRIMYASWFALPEQNKLAFLHSYRHKYSPHPERVKQCRLEALSVVKRAVEKAGR